MPMSSASGSRDFRISVVVEWENARSVAAQRPRAMLAELRRQSGELLTQSPPDASEAQREFFARLYPTLELIVVYDPCEITESAMSALLREAVGVDCNWIQLCLRPCADAQYYRVKNLGARLATGDLIIFLESA